MVDPVLSAAARAAALGQPTTALEDWRYVRTQSLTAAAYATPRVPAIEDLRRHVDASQRALVLVDGAFHSLGHGDWPALWTPTLPTAADDAALVASLAAENDAAACWAVADSTCRQMLRIRGQHPEPLHVVSVTTGGRSGWHLHLDLAPGSRLEVVVRHIALGDGRSCPRLAATLGAGATLVVSEIQATAAHHLLATSDLRLERDATARWTTVTRGGACVRFASRVILAGAGAHAELSGLAEVRDDHQAHVLTRVEHAVGPTTSDQLFKSVLHGRSASSFDGCVRILAGADGSNAEQVNRNLVLSPEARADTRPQLDIRADEVKASHGATVGQLDADELFYLRTRGLDAVTARELLTVGFSGEVLARLAHPQYLP